MAVYLLRHAKAGSRSGWDGPDDLRPLSKNGRQQAEALVDVLAGADISRIVSSPYVRCRQSVEPLGERLRLPVDLSDALAEGAPFPEVLRLVEKVSDETAVLCTHGDVIGELLDHAVRHGVRLDNDRIEKGSMWKLDLVDGAVVTASYLPPPE